MNIIYKDIKSNYMKNKIKGLPWEKRKYIDDLITLERWIVGEVGNWATAMKVHGLKSKYEIDYLEILKELKPERFEKVIKKKLDWGEKSASNMEKKSVDEKKKEDRLIKEWIEMGGKL